MHKTIDLPAAGYAFIPGVFQYSAGVAALPGHHLRRVHFAKPLPVREGFDRITEYLKAQGRPLAAFCACELRSPAPFDEVSFKAFNEAYVGTLRDWGIIAGGVNPVARSNVCPQFEPPHEPSFHSFAYTAQGDSGARSFVIAGSAEAPEGRENYRDHIVRRGDLSAAAIRDKAIWVIGEMERRMSAFGAGWGDTTVVQLYTVHNIYPFLEEELVRRGVLCNGLTWHFNRPPVVDLEYEMDCRRVPFELELDV